MLEKNHLHTIDNLFAAIEEKIITIKNVWKKIYYLKNDISHVARIFFHNFIRYEYRK